MCNQWNSSFGRFVTVVQGSIQMSITVMCPKIFLFLLLLLCAKLKMTFLLWVVIGDNPEIFSLKIFHGGQFKGFPGRRYTNAIIDHVDYVDADHFSVHEINDIVGELGHEKELMYYHFKVPEDDLDSGLRPLGNDSDVISLLKYVQNLNLIEVYIEHWVTRVNIHFMSPDSNRVVITELVDDQPSAGGNQRNLATPCRRNLAIEWHDQGGQSSGANQTSEPADALEPSVAQEHVIDYDKVVDATEPIIQQ